MIKHKPIQVHVRARFTGHPRSCAGNDVATARSHIAPGNVTSGYFFVLAIARIGNLCLFPITWTPYLERISLVLPLAITSNNNKKTSPRISWEILPDYAPEMPPFLRKWEHACSPLMHPSGGGGNATLWTWWTIVPKISQAGMNGECIFIYITLTTFNEFKQGTFHRVKTKECIHVPLPIVNDIKAEHVKISSVESQKGIQVHLCTQKYFRYVRETRVSSPLHQLSEDKVQ